MQININAIESILHEKFLNIDDMQYHVIVKAKAERRARLRLRRTDRSTTTTTTQHK